MKILIVSPYYDPAQMGVRLCASLNAHSHHEAESIVGIRTYFPSEDGGVPMLDQEPDLVLEARCQDCEGSGLIAGSHCPHCLGTGLVRDVDIERKVREKFETADVVHFNQFDWTYYPGGEATQKSVEWCYPLEWGKMVSPRHKLVFHGHGGAWLLDPDAQTKRCRNADATMVTCSPIDQVVVPGIRWMPNVMPVRQKDYRPAKRDFRGRLHAGMASCAPLYKGGEIAAYVFEYLRKFGYDVDFTVIEGLSLTAALRVRAAHHFTVDNWTQGFHGLAGLEGLSLGHVVFARLDPLAEEAWAAFADEMIPIVNVHGMDDCARWVRKYYRDRKALESKCKEGRAWMEKYYSEERLVGIWAGFYESL